MDSMFGEPADQDPAGHVDLEDAFATGRRQYRGSQMVPSTAAIPMVFGRDTLIHLDMSYLFCFLSTVSDEVFYVRMVLLTTIAPVAIALLLAAAFKLGLAHVT